MNLHVVTATRIVSRLAPATAAPAVAVPAIAAPKMANPATVPVKTSTMLLGKEKETQPSAIDRLKSFREEMHVDRAQLWAQYQELGVKFHQIGECLRQMDKRHNEELDGAIAVLELPN